MQNVYWDTIESEGDYQAIRAFMDTDDPLVLRRNQQRSAAEAYERWAENLENAPLEDIPEAVRDWHDATVDRFSLLSNVLYAMSEGAGAFDLLIYTESLEEISRAVEEGWDYAALVCGESWTSHFPKSGSESERILVVDYDGLHVEQPPVTQRSGRLETRRPGATLSYQGAQLGDPAAPVAFIIYADFQCSFCVQFHQGAYPRIIDDFVRDGQVKIEFREFPALGNAELTSDDNESVQAAEAALCAGEQGRYLEYHDTLYANFGGANLGTFSNQRLKTLAHDLGLDTDAFDECLDTGRYEPAVIQSLEEGRANGITATPMFIIDNGSGEPNVVQQTSAGYDLLKRQIEVAIELAR